MRIFLLITILIYTAELDVKASDSGESTQSDSHNYSTHPIFQEIKRRIELASSSSVMRLSFPTTQPLILSDSREIVPFNPYHCFYQKVAKRYQDFLPLFTYLQLKFMDWIGNPIIITQTDLAFLDKAYESGKLNLAAFSYYYRQMELGIDGGEYISPELRKLISKSKQLFPDVCHCLGYITPNPFGVVAIVPFNPFTCFYQTVAQRYEEELPIATYFQLRLVDLISGLTPIITQSDLLSLDKIGFRQMLCEMLNMKWTFKGKLVSILQFCAMKQFSERKLNSLIHTIIDFFLLNPEPPSDLMFYFRIDHERLKQSSYKDSIYLEAKIVPKLQELLDQSKLLFPKVDHDSNSIPGISKPDIKIHFVKDF